MIINYNKKCYCLCCYCKWTLKRAESWDSESIFGVWGVSSSRKMLFLFSKAAWCFVLINTSNTTSNLSIINQNVQFKSVLYTPFL